MIEKKYQLSKVQHTMSCIRACVDSIWEAWLNGESFPHKKEFDSEIDRLREMAKAIELKAYDLQKDEA